MRVEQGLAPATLQQTLRRESDPWVPAVDHDPGRRLHRTHRVQAGPRIIGASDLVWRRLGYPLQSTKSVVSPVMLHSADAGAPYLLRPGGACPALFVSGADVVGVAGAGASLGGGDEAEDSCSELLEFDGGRAGTCAPAAVRGFATRFEEGRGECPVEAAVLGETGAVVSLGEGGSVASLGEDGGVVVLGGCCTRVTAPRPEPTPDETVNRPANTIIVNPAAATTAAPMRPVPTTKALLIAARLLLCRDTRSSALDRRRPSAYPAEACSSRPRGSAKGSVRAKKSSSRRVTIPILRATVSSPSPTPARRSDPRT